jgi:thioredoxin-like negative regulator of GroEL
MVWSLQGLGISICSTCDTCNCESPHFSQNLKPEYERLAGILKGLVNVAAVDADQFKSLGGRFGIQGFPTIKLFNIDKQNPEDYQGERNSVAMLEYVLPFISSPHSLIYALAAVIARGP